MEHVAYKSLANNAVPCTDIALAVPAIHNAVYDTALFAAKTTVPPSNKSCVIVPDPTVASSYVTDKAFKVVAPPAVDTDTTTRNCPMPVGVYCLIVVLVVPRSTADV